MTYQKGQLKSKIIYSIETLWNRNMISPRQSMEPVSDIVAHENGTSYSHFTFNTKDELRFLINKFSREDPGIIYMGSHGAPGYFYLGNGNSEYITLAEIGELFKNKLKGRTFHLSSCELFNVPVIELTYLKKVTGAELVSCYTKTVDWIESSAMDMFLLDYILEYPTKLNRVQPELFKKFGNLIEYTGLIVL